MANAILHVRQFDVSGNACAIIFPDRSLAVFDWGELDEQVFPDLLDQHKIEKIRFVMATHAHIDHTRGLPEVLRTIVRRGLSIDAFLYPAIGRIDNRESNYLANSAIFARQNKIPVIPVDVKDFVTSKSPRPVTITDCPDTWEVVALAPPASVSNSDQIQSHLDARNPGNQTSIVSLYRPISDNKPHGRALLPGDATKTVLKFAKNHEKDFPEYSLHNDAMIAPHHGSKHNWPSWLNSYAQGLVVVSCGHSEPKLPAAQFLTDLSHHCKTGPSASRLLCTSYTAQCRQTYGAGTANARLIHKGPCFGTVEIELDISGSKLVSHDPNGPRRRPFGFCGQ